MGLIVLQRRGTVLLVGLDRPDKLNALDEAMAGELDAALVDARRDPCIVVIHSTAPGVFAAGADIAELIERDADAALRAINAGLFDRLEAHRWPTIAAVDGPALGGGCELALACDLRLASPRARFGQPELGLGILAGAGANWRLPRRSGRPSRAACSTRARSSTLTPPGPPAWSMRYTSRSSCWRPPCPSASASPPSPGARWS